MAMTAICLLEAETAPLAGGGCVLVPSVDLDILNGVSQAELVHSGAPRGVTVYFYNRESIDKLLSVALVSLLRDLESVGLPVLIVKLVLWQCETPARGRSESQHHYLLTSSLHKREHLYSSPHVFHHNFLVFINYIII